MKRKVLVAIFSVILAIALVSSAFYPEPWGTNVDADNNDLYNVRNVNATNINGNFSGTLNWTDLQNYPVACPGSGAITLLNDSVTCSDLWVDVAGDTMTGNLNMSNKNITDVGKFNEILYVQAGNGTDIQTKIDMCPSNGNCSIIIPNSNYVIDTTITLPSNKRIKIIGSGKYTTTLQVNSARDAFNFSNNSYAHFSNMKIYSSGDFVSLGETNGLMGVRNFDENITIDWLVEDVLFENLTNGIRHKQTAINDANVVIRNNNFIDFNDNVSTSISYSVISFQMTKSDNKDFIIENNFINTVSQQGDRGRGITINGNDASLSSGIIVQDNRLFNLSSDGIRVQEFSNAVISNNIVKYFGQNNDSHREGIIINKNNNSVVEGNIVTEGFGRVLRLNSNNNTRVQNNVLYGGENGLDAGVSRIVTNNNLSFVRNTLRSDKSTAINITDSTSNNVLIEYNTFLGSNIDIVNSGTNSIIRHNFGRESSETHFGSGFGSSEHGNLVLRTGQNVVDEIYMESDGDSNTTSVAIRFNNSHGSIDPETSIGRIIFESNDVSTNGQGDASEIKSISANFGTNYDLVFSTKRDIEGITEKIRITNDGILRQVVNTTSLTCDATNAGGIYYDGTTFTHYGCNSTHWNALY